MDNDTAVYVDTIQQQQKDFVIVVVECTEQKDDITKEDKAEYGIKIDS